MGWLVLGLRPAVENGVRSGSKEVCARHELVGMPFACTDGDPTDGGPTETEVRARMKMLLGMLLGIDPHKTSLAVAAIDEATDDLLERVAFPTCRLPQDRAGLRSLERVGHAGPAAPRLGRLQRQQRFYDLPQPVCHQFFRHVEKGSIRSKAGFAMHS
jgi:hypothetical protein